MEPLILPTEGLVYVDANAIIYSVERVEPYHGLLTPMWEEARAGRFTLASSELIALESPISPRRDGNARLEMPFRLTLVAAEKDLIPETPKNLGRHRSHLRRDEPDALHGATAFHSDCAAFS